MVKVILNSLMLRLALTEHVLLIFIGNYINKRFSSLGHFFCFLEHIIGLSETLTQGILYSIFVVVQHCKRPLHADVWRVPYIDIQTVHQYWNCI